MTSGERQYSCTIVDMNKYEKLLLGGAAFWWFGEGLFGPLFAVFTGKVGGDILDVTWAWATYLLVTGVIEIWVGRVSDRIGHAKLMVAGYALNAVFTFGYLFVSESWHLFVVQAGLGVALALADPTWDALYAIHESRKKAGLLWGISHGAEQLITGTSILIGGFIVANYSFEALFLIMGLIQVVGVFYQAQILWMERRPQKF